jgi:hypothetical protein
MLSVNALKTNTLSHLDLSLNRMFDDFHVQLLVRLLEPNTSLQTLSWNRDIVGSALSDDLDYAVLMCQLRSGATKISTSLIQTSDQLRQFVFELKVGGLINFFI